MESKVKRVGEWSLIQFHLTLKKFGKLARKP